jgi:predicted secreted protein
MRLLQTVLLLLLLTPLAYGEPLVVPKIPDSATVVHIKESAYKTIVQDKARATIRVETQSGTAEEVKSFIEVKIRQAEEIAKEFPKVDIVKGRYAIHRQYNPKTQRKDLWIGSQSLVLDSYNTADLTHLVGKIENLDLVGTIQYYLSEEKYSSYKDDLISSAMDAIKRRAKKIASNLRLRNVKIAEISMESAVRYAPYSGTHRIISQTNMVASSPPLVASQKDEMGITIDAVVYLTP